MLIYLISVLIASIVSILVCYGMTRGITYRTAGLLAIVVLTPVVNIVCVFAMIVHYFVELDYGSENYGKTWLDKKVKFSNKKTSS